MKLVATAASLSRNTYQVVIAYHDEQDRTIWTMPTINIPARDIYHAEAIARAINNPDWA